MSGEEFPGFGGGEQPDMVVAEGPAVENAELAPEGPAVENAELAPEGPGGSAGTDGPVYEGEGGTTIERRGELSDASRALLLNSETPDIIGHLGELKAAGISGGEIAHVLAGRSELEDNLSKLFEAGFDIASIISEEIDPIQLAEKFKKFTEEFGVPGEIIVDVLLKSNYNKEAIFEGLLAGEAPLEILAQYTPELFITQVASGREGINPNVDTVALAFNSLLAKNKPHVPDNGQDFKKFEREYGDYGDSTAATERIRIILKNVDLVKGPDGEIASGLVDVDAITNTAPDGLWRSLTKEEAQRMIDLGVKTEDIYKGVINCPVVLSGENKFAYGEVWGGLQRLPYSDRRTIRWTKLEEGDKLDYAWFSGHGLSDQQMVDIANEFNRGDNPFIRRMPIEEKLKLCGVTL